MLRKFEFEVDQAKVNEWLTDVVYPKIRKNKKIRWEAGYPYYGPIGGGISYHLYPTSLGYIIKVKEHFSEMELDLTDYDSF